MGHRTVIILRYEINNNAVSFSLDLREAHLPFETPSMASFAKIVNGWIYSNKFAKGSILDVLLGSEYVFGYLGFFSIIMNLGCPFESSKNLFNFMSVLFKCQE